MNDPVDPDGWDLDWFAVDRDGHLGHFSSFGSRVILPAALASKRERDRLFDGVMALPRRSRILRVTAGYLPSEDWGLMAERGLFSYDFISPEGMGWEVGTYGLVYAPKEPVLLSSLPPESQAPLERLRLPDLCFAVTSRIERSHLGLPPA